MSALLKGDVARRLALIVAATCGLIIGATHEAKAANVAWTIDAVSEPSTFSPTDTARCEEHVCGRYQLLIENAGSETAGGPVTLTVKLPEGITTERGQVESGESSEGGIWTCTTGVGVSTLNCSFPEGAPSGGYLPNLEIVVTPPSGTLVGTTAKAEFVVEGGGAAAPVVRVLTTPIAAVPDHEFELTQFAFTPGAEDGSPSTQAAGHPWQLNTTLSVSTIFSPPSAPSGNATEIANNFVPTKNLKDVVVKLPMGMIGNPQAAPKCEQTALTENHCPTGSQIGEFAISGGEFELGVFEHTGHFCCSAVYNMVPESGYPAEFGLKFAGKTITLYASVVHTLEGYALRVASTDLPAALELDTTVLTIFGDPSAADGGPSGTAFLTNPSHCGTSVTASTRLTPWEAPGSPIEGTAVGYPSVTGCEALSFAPTFAFQQASAAEEGTTRSDTPSAFDATLDIPQTTSYTEAGTPPLRDATVTLPPGVSVAAAAAAGLSGCSATGPTGINIGSGDIGANEQDLGDPEATELGEGHGGGDGVRTTMDCSMSRPGTAPRARRWAPWK